MTYKQRFNAVLEIDKDTEHSLKDLTYITGIPLKILKEVEKRGYGAHKNNLASVRLKDFSKNPDLRKGKSKRLSAEQWARGRVYSFIYKSVFQDMRYKKHDMDLYNQLFKK